MKNLLVFIENSLLLLVSCVYESVFTEKKALIKHYEYLSTSYISFVKASEKHYVNFISVMLN